MPKRHNGNGKFCSPTQGLRKQTYTRFALNFFSLVVVCLSASQSREVIFSMEDLVPALFEEKRDKVPSCTLAVSRVTLIPDNQCAKVAYLGMAYFAPL